MQRGGSLDGEGDGTSISLQDSNGNSYGNGKIDLNVLTQNVAKILKDDKALSNRKKSQQKGMDSNTLLTNISADVPSCISKIPRLKAPKDPRIPVSMNRVPPHSATSIKGSASPKFRKDNEGNLSCARCGDLNTGKNTLCCSICNTMFHALCKNLISGFKDPKAITTPSFLKQVAPVISKTGLEAQRWGHFLFVCNRCRKRISDLQKEICSSAPKQTSLQTENSSKAVILVDSGTMTSSSGLALLTESSMTEPIGGNVIAPPASTTMSRDVTEKLLSEVGDKVGTMLSDFENRLMSNVNKLLDEKTASWAEHSTPRRLPTHRFSTPSGSSSLTDDSAVFSTANRSPPSGNLVTSDSAESSIKSYASVSSRGDIISDAPHTPGEKVPSPVAVRYSPSPNTSSKFAGNRPRNPKDCVVILNCKDDKDLAVMEKDIEQELKNIPLNFMKTNYRTKNIVISFPSDLDRDNGKAIIADLSKVKSQSITLQDAKKMMPKITVSNIPNKLISTALAENPSTTPAEYRDKVKEVLHTKFLEKNSDIRDLVESQDKMFQIVFVNTGNESTTAGIKVSPLIRDALISRGRIYVGNTSCRVTDRFDLRQCFHCQQIGHISSKCQEKSNGRDPVCMFCSASHPTKDCPDRDDESRYRCINCSHSGDSALRNNCHTHHSGSDDCPLIAAEKSNIRQRTEYSKNV